MKITRREFTKLFTGGLLGTILPLSIFGKDKQKLIYAKDIDIRVITASDIKADTIPSGEKGYNLIDDLVDEMNKRDREHPEYELLYNIRCNYSGLGWLDAHGKLEKERLHSFSDYALRNISNGYLLDIPLRYDCCRGVISIETCIQKVDIQLLCYQANYYSNGFLESHVVITRCSNIDYTKRGKDLMRRLNA